MRVASKPQKLRAGSLDLAHLAAQTGGDLLLQRELLDLFVAQSAEFMARLPGLAEADPGRAGDLAHKLNGSARAIGAFELAGAAANLERAFAADNTFAALEPVTSALGKALRAVEAYLAELAPRLNGCR
jgi:HPt (histidine-containing phosphotransfer) domain-containing protein